eukprot:COSAG01_NODE_54258_length_333_cov_0.918803_1_plen_53_part_01
MLYVPQIATESLKLVGSLITSQDEAVFNQLALCSNNISGKRAADWLVYSHEPT